MNIKKTKSTSNESKLDHSSVHQQVNQVSVDTISRLSHNKQPSLGSINHPMKGKMTKRPSERLEKSIDVIRKPIPNHVMKQNRLGAELEVQKNF